ncbi:MAG TPA: alpha/beta hydrolase [Chitinophagaceae bacterium]|nr:alpha/beta hydrolase [Chitinophagaceae bacterium]
MDIVIKFIQVLAAVAGALAALLSIPLFFPFRWPAAVMWGLKVYVSALSPFLALLGILTAIAGITTGSVILTVIGIYDSLVYFIHFILVTRPPASAGNFEKAFGLNWEKRLDSRQKNLFLPARTELMLPAVANPQLEQNIEFAVIPGTDRKLLCDLWQPGEYISPSGLAFIYLHGSAFYFLDKDCGTRPLFSYLTAQGHVIMDVAYRLAPETDIMGMVHDAKRAIAWLKENGVTYGINPNRIVLGGASAGGHLALLTAYTAINPLFTPGELEGKDLSVCGVISLYGPTDLEALYFHLNQHLTTRSSPNRPKKDVPTKMPEWMKKRIGKDYHRLGMDKDFEKIGTLAPLLGGHPDECPESYAFLSPFTHIHSGCPPTLLLQGAHDIMAPVKTTRVLHSLLVKENIPTVLHILPQTDHAFDLVLPKISPSAHNAFYDIERFMAIMAEVTKVENRAAVSNLVTT